MDLGRPGITIFFFLNIEGEGRPRSAAPTELGQL